MSPTSAPDRESPSVDGQGADAKQIYVYSRRRTVQDEHAGGWSFSIEVCDAANVRQYQAGEDVEKRCLAGTCPILTPGEFAVERIGKVLAVGLAKRGRAASVDTTAA